MTTGMSRSDALSKSLCSMLIFLIIAGVSNPILARDRKVGHRCIGHAWTPSEQKQAVADGWTCLNCPHQLSSTLSDFFADLPASHLFSEGTPNLTAKVPYKDLCLAYVSTTVNAIYAKDKDHCEISFLGPNRYCTPSEPGTDLFPEK